MKIDSHQHFWSYQAAEYPWITDQVRVLRRDYLPADLEPELKAAGLDGCIAVQARQSLEESRWLLNLADHYPIIKGVVGWVDLRSENASSQLAELAEHPRFSGVRHVVQDEPDDRFLVQPDFMRGIAALQKFDLAYDLLIVPKQLPAAIELVRRCPEQRFVVDHLAKPLIKDGVLEPWAKSIRELAKLPNVFCKVSGLVTEARWHEWQARDFKPYLDVAAEAFGEDRLMYGSDWPVCFLSGEYRRVHGLVKDWLSDFSSAAAAKIMGANAARFYRVT